MGKKWRKYIKGGGGQKWKVPSVRRPLSDWIIFFCLFVEISCIDLEAFLQGEVSKKNISDENTEGNTFSLSTFHYNAVRIKNDLEQEFTVAT